MQILILILFLCLIGSCLSILSETVTGAETVTEVEKVKEVETDCRTIKIINNKPEIFQTFCPSDKLVYEYLVNERIENVPDNGEIINRLYGIIVSYDKVKVSKTNYFSQSLHMSYINETHISNGTITQTDISYVESDSVFLTRNFTSGIFPGLQENDYTGGIAALVTDGLVLYPHYGVQLLEPYSYSVYLEDKMQQIKQSFNITMRYNLYGELEGLLDHTEENKDRSISKLYGTYHLTIKPTNGLVIKNSIILKGSVHYFDFFPATGKLDKKTDDIHILMKIESKLISQRPRPLPFKDEL